VDLKELHAAFLTESRTPNHVWCRVQEIRVARLFRPTYAAANVGHPSLRTMGMVVLSAGVEKLDGGLAGLIMA
jgi:hypothetical protein